MKFTCPKRVFHEALQSVSRAVATRSTLPILSNVLIEAKKGRLQFTTTDLEIGMTHVVPMDIDTEGAVTVPERVIQDVVANLPDAELEVSADERHLLTLATQAPRSRYTIHGLPAEEFPSLPQVTSEVVLSVPGPVLRDIVRKTLFAASTDEARIILTGCLLNWDGQTATMVATDTHRLAVKHVPMGGQPGGSASAIIPSRALQELLRLLGSSEDPVQVVIGASQVQFSVTREGDSREIKLISRLIEGQFPAYERVIPPETPKRMTANRQLFFEAVRRAGIVARAESNKIILKSEDSTLRITAETGEIGRAEEEIPVSLDGEPIEIAFNATYLQEVLAVLDTETFELGFSGPLNPGIIRADGEPDYSYVVMPMQML